MKRIVLLFLFMGLIYQAQACDVKFSIAGEKKTGFKTGDEVVVTVTVTLIHHNCPVELKQTKFTYEGLEILGATNWKEIQPGTYTRDIKVKITDAKGKESKLTTTRQCEKEGGYGNIVFKRA